MPLNNLGTESTLEYRARSALRSIGYALDDEFANPTTVPLKWHQ